MCSETDKDMREMLDILSDGQWHPAESFVAITREPHVGQMGVVDSIAAAYDSGCICIIQPDITPESPPISMLQKVAFPSDAEKHRQKTFRQQAQRRLCWIRRGYVLDLLRHGAKRAEAVEKMQSYWPGYTIEQFHRDKRRLRETGRL